MDTIITNLENLIKHNKVIGISISGGLDSTLLAYLLHDIKYKTNTDTCTGSKNLRCNQCWQCCERSWAFAKNNLIDTGKM